MKIFNLVRSGGKLENKLRRILRGLEEKFRITRGKLEKNLNKSNYYKYILIITEIPSL